MERLINILHEGNHSLVVSNGESTKVYDGRGIADLYAIFTSHSEMLDGAHIADKVVGKGAASLMALGGVVSVYADVISVPAHRLLTEAAVEVSFGRLVPNIINRRGDGLCPVEQLCLSCVTPNECLPLISDFMENVDSLGARL